MGNSKLQLTTSSYGQWRQRRWSNWLFVTPPSTAVPSERLVHSINRCSLYLESTLQPSAYEAPTLPMRPLRECQVLMHRLIYNYFTAACIDFVEKFMVDGMSGCVMCWWKMSRESSPVLIRDESSVESCTDGRWVVGLVMCWWEVTRVLSHVLMGGESWVESCADGRWLVCWVMCWWKMSRGLSPVLMGDESWVESCADGRWVVGWVIWWWEMISLVKYLKVKLFNIMSVTIKQNLQTLRQHLKATNITATLESYKHYGNTWNTCFNKSAN